MDKNKKIRFVNVYMNKEMCSTWLSDLKTRHFSE